MRAFIGGVALVLIVTCASPAFCADDDNSESAKKGFEALQLSQTDQRAIVAAARFFSQAADEYEKTGKTEKAVEMNSFLYWCKKKMTMRDIDEFIKAGETGTVKRLDKVADKVNPSQAEDWMKRANDFAAKSPDKHLLIAIRFFEVADRFKGTDISRDAQDRSLSEMQKFLDPASKTAATPGGKQPAGATPAPGAAAEQTDHKRDAIPSAADLKSSEKLIHEAFAEDFIKTTPDAQAALATKLLEQLEQLKADPAGRYTVLHEIALLSAKSGDFDRMLTTLKRFSEEFAVDLKAETKTVLAAFPAPKDPELSKVVAALRSLQDNADSPMQNLTVGRYVLSKDNWTAALPYLAKGSDAALKKLAEKELADGPDKMALGDGWWDLSEAETNKAFKPKYVQRAALHYTAVLPTVTGLTKVKVEKRIATGTPVVAAPKTTAAVTDSSPRTASRERSESPDAAPEKCLPVEVENGILKGGSYRVDHHLKAGTYRGANSILWPDGDYLNRINLFLDPGVEISNATFHMGQGGAIHARGELDKPIIFHNCTFLGSYNTLLHAENAIFEKCRFEKTGTVRPTDRSGSATFWRCHNCLFDSLVLSQGAPLYYGLKFDDCVFNTTVFPQVTFSRDTDYFHSVRSYWRHFNNCTYIECGLCPYFVWTSTQCNFYYCKFSTGDPYDSETELVIDSYFLQPSGKFPDTAKKKPVVLNPAKAPVATPTVPKNNLPSLQNKAKLIYPQ